MNNKQIIILDNAYDRLCLVGTLLKNNWGKLLQNLSFIVQPYVLCLPLVRLK